MKIIFFLFISFIALNTYADVPYEVFKTETTASVIKHFDGESRVIVIDGTAYNQNHNYTPKKGVVDTRTKVVLSGISYSLKFWNVGKMGNKGWTSFGGYEKARLTIGYVAEKAFHLEDTGKINPMFGMNYYEEKEDEIPYINNLVFDLTFLGGPYGSFLYNDKVDGFVGAGHVVDGAYIKLGSLGKNKGVYIYPQDVIIPIPYDAFGKWMEILKGSNCGDSGIRFSDYNGEVMYGLNPDDKDSWNAAEVDAVLCKNTHVETGDDSTCVLSLADMTTFKMKPNSEIILTNPPSKESKIRLILGKVLINVKQMLKDGTMDVEMSEATAGIKGTIFELEDNGKESKLKVLRGLVEFTSKNTGKKTMVKAGNMITATRGGLGEIKDFNKNNIEKEWQTIKEVPLGKAISDKKIKEISIKDPNRGEIKEKKSGEEVLEHKKESVESNSFINKGYIFIILILSSLFGFLYYRYEIVRKYIKIILKFIKKYCQIIWNIWFIFMSLFFKNIILVVFRYVKNKIISLLKKYRK